MGITNAEFQHSNFPPIYGMGQGGANSPVLWCLISNRVFEAHNTHSHGATFSSPRGTHKIRLKMLGLVDDTYSGVNMFENNRQPIKEILKRAEFDAQLWSDLLNTSGGALELLKVKLYVIHIGSDPTGKPIMLELTENQRMEVDGNDGD